MDHSALALRQSITRFTCSPSSSRRSSRLSASHKVDIKIEPPKVLASPPTTPSKRKRLKEDSSSGETPKKRKDIIKRGYADPTAYAHLKELHDCLAPSLDVVFCGVNPGCMSAAKGHHFANPTNHFWKSLHLSGLTSKLLLPSEDETLPALYSLGLTNLVSRPSAEQAELSKEEMKDSVPLLKTKIVNYRPRIVCFVGKGIWLTTESVFKHQTLEVGPLSSHIMSQPIQRAPRKKASSFDWGLQPYKLVYTDSEGTTVKEEVSMEPNVAIDAATPRAASVVAETLFFVMPSTSGRVVSHQLSDKVKLFSHLRNDLQRLKSNMLDTSEMAIVSLS
ncbi:DNA glycosylase [Ramaria rubella]|nr:DNA glycosylase [Ramaria rubella]